MTDSRLMCEVYDLVNDVRGKDYAAEARWIMGLVTKRGVRLKDATLVDAGCGTGRHLMELAAAFHSVSGFDPSEAALNVAKQRLNGRVLTLLQLEIHEALDLRFDVTTCMFGTIAYAAVRRELGILVEDLARWTAHGGLVLIEPWVSPDEYEPEAGRPVVAERNGVAVTRMTEPRDPWEDDLAAWTYHFMVLERGRVRHESEEHEVRLIHDADMERAMSRYLTNVECVDWTPGRKLWIGRKE